jgi:RNA polymerase sigma factor (sigma-70 family)
MAMSGEPGQRQQAPADSAPGRAVLEALWHEHRRWVAAVLLAHKPREAELEDLLQEVAMTFVTRVHELRDPAALRPWLRTVAVNAARMDARRVRVRRAALRPLQDEHDQLADPAHARDRRAAEARAEAQAALAAAQALPEEYREPLLLRCLRGLSQKQIAATLGLPETTVETRLARARRLLRERLAPPTVPPGPAAARASAGARPS